MNRIVIVEQRAVHVAGDQADIGDGRGRPEDFVNWVKVVGSKRRGCFIGVKTKGKILNCMAAVVPSVGDTKR